MRPTDELWCELKPRQAEIEASLRARMAGLLTDVPPLLREAMAYSLLAPGKRLRPLLCLLACEAAGGDREQALPGACAVEMVHTYSLIHDDLPAMDDDDLRRGLPTCHKKFGEAMGILAGDALLTLAFEVLAGGCPARTAAVSCAELASGAGAVGMVGGQVLDLESEGRLTASAFAGGLGLTELENIHRRKTGALFRSALRMGIYAATAERPAGPDAEALAAADRYAAAFGLGFQIADDLLDVEGSAETAGKRVGKDAARGKLTYPGLVGVAESRRRAEELCREAVASAQTLASPLLAELARAALARDR